MSWVRNPRFCRTGFGPSGRQTGWRARQWPLSRSPGRARQARKRLPQPRRARLGLQCLSNWDLRLPPMCREPCLRSSSFVQAPTEEPTSDPTQLSARRLGRLLQLPQPDSVDGVQVGDVYTLEPQHQRYHEKSYQQMDHGDSQGSLHMSWERVWPSYSTWGQSLVSIMGLKLSSGAAWHSVGCVLEVVRSLPKIPIYETWLVSLMGCLRWVQWWSHNNSQSLPSFCQQKQWKTTNKNLFPDIPSDSLPTKIRLGFEQFDVHLYVPPPHRCFKCQKFGHNSRSVEPERRYAKHALPQATAKTHAQTRTTPNAWTVKVHTPPSSRHCPRFATEKAALQIQAESNCSLVDAWKQVEQTSATTNTQPDHASTPDQHISYARSVAINQAELINHNLTLSEDNARLRDVINQLRLDNMSLQQRLENYGKRLSNLEKSSLDSAHQTITPSSLGSTHSPSTEGHSSALPPDTTGGVHNTTSVGGAHTPTPVGDAHSHPVSKANKASQTETHERPQLPGQTLCWPDSQKGRGQITTEAPLSREEVV